MFLKLFCGFVGGFLLWLYLREVLLCTSFGILIRSRPFAISFFMGGKVQKSFKPEFW